jgi:hypothetical protein
MNKGSDNKVRKIIDVVYILDGIKRHAYFKINSERLENFKKNFQRKIVDIQETSINNTRIWLN